MKTAPYGNNGKRGQSKNEGANTGRPKSFKDVSKFAKTLSSQNPFTRRGFTSNDLDNSPSVSNQFSENHLLKATNVYQQFDKRGNIYENKLYVKTSINQVKLAQDHATYSKKMESKLEEEFEKRLAETHYNLRLLVCKYTRGVLQEIQPRVWTFEIDSINFGIRFGSAELQFWSVPRLSVQVTCKP